MPRLARSNRPILRVTEPMKAPRSWAECGRQANRDAQEANQLERLPLAPLKDQIQGLTARS